MELFLAKNSWLIFEAVLKSGFGIAKMLLSKFEHTIAICYNQSVNSVLSSV
jgi:hypothetical protein